MPNEILKTLIPFDGVVNWNVVLKSNNRLRWPCYTFMKLDKKTHHIEFSLKMFIYANDTIK
jgi:hypothetical protein